jgi:hypothetical protein
MKNVREWKSMEGENKLEYFWFVQDKQGNNGDHIYLYCVKLEHVQVKLSGTWLVTRCMFGTRHRYCLCTFQTKKNLYQVWISFQIEQL